MTRPRRIPPTPQQRANRILTQTRGAPSAQGAVPAARPVTVTPRSHARQAPLPGVSGVTVGDTSGGGGYAIAIAATTADSGTTVASATGAVAVGPQATATASSTVALGDTAAASAASAIAVGRVANVSCAGAIVIGDSAIVVSSSDRAVAIGPDAGVNLGHYGGAIGSGTTVTGDGGWAIGCDSSGVGAAATAANQLALGTANHIAIVKGKLVIADASGGLHQIVVSTGGALSTVAYP